MAALNPLKSAQILPMFVIIDQYSKSDLDYADFSLISGADRLTLKQSWMPLLRNRQDTKAISKNSSTLGDLGWLGRLG